MNHGPSTYTVNRSLKGRRTTSFQGFGSMSVAVCGALILSFEQAQFSSRRARMIAKCTVKQARKTGPVFRKRNCELFLPVRVDLPAVALNSRGIVPDSVLGAAASPPDAV